MAGSENGRLAEVRRTLLDGVVIPAHPLALTESRQLDERRQVALTRYYCDAGAGGLAIGVHTTQFEIRESSVQLLKPVLGLAANTVAKWCAQGERPVMIAGVCGPTSQALAEAELALSLDYDAALLSLAAFRARRQWRRAGTLPPRRRRDPGRRLLPAASRGRTYSRSGLLAWVTRHRTRGRDQGCSIRSLSHARRRHGSGAERTTRCRALNGK